MKLIKFLSFICAFLALVNITDVHALSHLIEGDDHTQIENCDVCEEFVVSSTEDENTNALIPNFNYSSTPNFSELFTAFISTESFSLLPQKSLGKYFNKPPPHTI